MLIRNSEAFTVCVSSSMTLCPLESVRIRLNSIRSKGSNPPHCIQICHSNAEARCGGLLLARGRTSEALLPTLHSGGGELVLDGVQQRWQMANHMGGSSSGRL